MPKPKHDALLQRIRDNYDTAEEDSRDQREEMLIDHRFAIGIGQWNERIRAIREEDNRPCLTINRVKGHIKQVVNDIRRNKPSAKASPAEKSDVDLSEIFTGLMREIDRRSNAPAIRSYAIDQAVRGGIGYYKVSTDWVSPESFDQEIWLERILNWASVFIDPSAEKPDRTDADWAFEVAWIKREEFERQYEKAELVTHGFDAMANQAPKWVSRDGALVGRYWEKEYTDKLLVMLSDGTGKIEDELTDDDDPVVRDGKFVTRPTRLVKVKGYKTNGVEILEETDWPSIYIPIIPVVGDEMVVEDERHIEGIVRPARDSVRGYNVFASVQTEAINAAGKTPIIATPEQVAGHEKLYQNANKGLQSVRYYNPHTHQGALLPPPAREVVEPPIQAIAQSRQMAADDIKATTGIFDASLGNRSNETSGVAIRERRQEGDNANYHFTDGLQIAITLETRIKMDLMPRLYSRPGRIARILGENDDERLVELNVPTEDRGKSTIFDLGAAKYDAVVDIGPGVDTQRQESAQFVESAIKAFPPLFEVAGDILMENSDAPGARQIAERLRKRFGIDDEKGDKIPPKAQQQIQQLSEMNDALSQQLQELAADMKTKRFDLESKERIALQNNEVDLFKARMDVMRDLLKTDSAEAVEEVRLRFQKLESDIDRRQAMVKENEPVAADAGKPTTNGGGTR